MADFDGFVTNKSVDTLFQFDGTLHTDHSNPHDGYVNEKGPHVCFQYDGENFCTCATSTPPIHTSSISSAAGLVTVSFNSLVQLSGPALVPSNWYFSSDDGHLVTTTHVVVDGNNVKLSVTPQTDGAHYTLNLPQVGITSTDFGVFTGLFSMDFTGVPTPVNTSMIRSVDTHHIDVIFDIAVDPVAALDPTNYTLNNGLTVTAVVRITDVWYRLRNDPRQVDGTNYTLTVSNIGPKV